MLGEYREPADLDEPSRDTIGEQVQFVGDLVYTLGSRGFQAIDFSEPEPPQIAGVWSLPGEGNEIVVRDGIAYVGFGAEGLQIVDVSDPHPQPFRPWAETGYGDKAVDGDASIALVTSSDERMLRVFDITVADDSTPAELLVALNVDIGFGDGPVDVSLAGTTAFVCFRGYAVLVFDMTDPTTPNVPSLIDTGGDPRRILVEGDTAYVLDANPGLVTIDIADPANPVTLYNGELYDDIDGCAIEILGGVAFCLSAGRDLDLVDITDPTNPRQVAGPGLVGDFLGSPPPFSRRSETELALVPGRVLIVDDNGLRVIDLGDCPLPCAPDLSGDGLLTFEDLVLFLDRLASGHPGADMDPQGDPDGVFGFFDLLVYLTYFSLGCP